MNTQPAYGYAPKRNRRHTSKPTKAETRARQDQANNQAAWNSTFIPRKVEPELTNYERSINNVWSPRRVNYLNLDTASLERALELAHHTTYRPSDDPDPSAAIRAALTVRQFEALTANLNTDPRIQEAHRDLCRAYAEATLQAKIESAYHDRINDCELVVANILHNSPYCYLENPPAEWDAIRFTNDCHVEILNTLRNCRAKQPIKDTDKPLTVLPTRNPFEDLIPQALGETLKRKVNQVYPFINKRASLPILRNILFRGQGNTLTLSATDLEVGITVHVPCKDIPYVDLAIDGQTCHEWMDLARDDNTRLFAYNHTLAILQRANRANFIGIDGSEYPAIATTIPETQIQVADSDVFKAALKPVLAGVSKEQNRPILTGVLFEVKEGTLHLVSADGYRIAQRSMDCESLVGDTSFIVPGSALNKIVKVLPDHTALKFAILERLDDKGKISLRQLVMSWGDTIITSQLIDGQFPAYETIIPTTFDHTGSVDLDTLIKALKTVKQEFVYLNAGDQEFQVTGSNYDTGDQTVKVPYQDNAAVPERYTLYFNRQRLIGSLNEIAKHTAKPTKKNPFVRTLAFQWNTDQNILVMEHGGIQGTLMACKQPER